MENKDDLIKVANANSEILSFTEEEFWLKHYSEGLKT